MLKRYMVSLWVLFILIVSPVFQSAAAESVSLSAVIGDTGSVFRWEPYREVGELSFRGEVITFKPDSPVLLVNYRNQILIDPVYRTEKGELKFPSSSAGYIRDFFSRKADAFPDFRIAAIIIDPGHGGKDPGAIGRHMIEDRLLEVLEKDIVLTVSQALYRKLAGKYSDKKIIMTRNSDIYLTLEERTEIANSIELDSREAMIFVSVHANASLNSKAEGFEVWYLPPDYRRALIDPAKMSEDLRDVVPILNTMMEEEISLESILLAGNILEGLSGTVGNISPSRGLKEESWFVVRNARMPSVLVELGFVTNKREAVEMKKSAYLMKLADGIYNGIIRFVEYFENTD